MVSPLDAYIGFGNTTFANSDDKLWVALTLNKSGRSDGKYDYTKNDFKLPASVLGGVISPTGEHFLVASLASGCAGGKEGLFEFKVWKQGTDGAKGSFDKESALALEKQWQIDGSNGVINVDNIPVLKVLVKTLAEFNVFVMPVEGILTVDLSITEEQTDTIKSDLSSLFGHLIEHKAFPPEATAAYDAGLRVASTGLMAIPVTSKEQLPSVSLKNPFGQVTGHKIFCFPYSGELPCYDSIDVTIPAKEAKKESKGSGWGGASVDPAKAIAARKQFILDEYKLLQGNEITLLTIFGDAETSPEKQAYLNFLVNVLGK